MGFDSPADGPTQNSKAMHIHIVIDASTKDVLAVFGTTGQFTPHGLESTVEKAIDAAISEYVDDPIARAAEILETKGIFRFSDGDNDTAPPHVFMSSQYWR